MTRYQELTAKLEYLAELTGKATSKEDAISKGFTSYLYIAQKFENSYELVEINVKTGSEPNPFNLSTHSHKFKEMYLVLCTLLSFIRYQKEA